LDDIFDIFLQLAKKNEFSAEILRECKFKSFRKVAHQMKGKNFLIQFVSIF
jgi:hypothetical protein